MEIHLEKILKQSKVHQLKTLIYENNLYMIFQSRHIQFHRLKIKLDIHARYLNLTSSQKAALLILPAI